MKNELDLKPDSILWKNLKIGECEKRKINVIYPIEISFDKGSTKTIWRRYSDFEFLLSHLISSYPHSIIPNLPDKKIGINFFEKSSDKNEVYLLENKRIGLERFLSIICKHPIISADDALYSFLQRDDETWKQKVTSKKKGKMEQVMSRLNNVLNLNHSVEDDKSQIHSDNSSNQESQDIVVGDYENKLRRHIDYCEAISKELQNFLKVSLKVRIGEFQTAKLLHELGGLWSLWSGMEDDDGYQIAGHYVDAISQDVECFLDDQDQEMGCIKNHLSDLQAVKDACKRSLEDTEKFRTHTSPPHFLDTANTNLPSQQLPSMALNNNSKNDTVMDLNEKQRNMLQEIEGFHSNREDDMSEMMLKHALLQINKSLKASNSWQKVIESLSVP